MIECTICEKECSHIESSSIRVGPKLIKFLVQCFRNNPWNSQSDPHYGDGAKYPLYIVIEAYNKWVDDDYYFSYNCNDCSFPKFRKVSDENYHEACPNCGD